MVEDIDGTTTLQKEPAPSILGGRERFCDPPEAVVTSNRWERSKRVFDVLVATIMLIVLTPLLALIAVAIVLDSPGPVLFRQKRHGRGRRPFVVLKFRSMQYGASADVHRRYIRQLATDEDGVGSGLKKLTRDVRVTRVGAVLRRTSLDEIPQLINVVRGEMSIVGPRPALTYELEYYEPDHYARFAVRPGLTGLWQVSGRNEIGFLGMLSLDAEYARSSSARLDAKILLRTPLAVFEGKAA